MKNRYIFPHCTWKISSNSKEQHHLCCICLSLIGTIYYFSWLDLDRLQLIPVWKTCLNLLFHLFHADLLGLFWIVHLNVVYGDLGLSPLIMLSFFPFHLDLLYDLIVTHVSTFYKRLTVSFQPWSSLVWWIHTLWTYQLLFGLLV